VRKEWVGKAGRVRMLREAERGRGEWGEGSGVGKRGVGG